MYMRFDRRKPINNSTTVSFLLPNELYEKLCDRLPKHGSRSDFFRTLVEKFLDGKLEVVQERRF